MRGELDWIVMKALEKDRARRYETANGFARDIRRYLDGDAGRGLPAVGRPTGCGSSPARTAAALATAAAFATLLSVGAVVEHLAGDPRHAGRGPGRGRPCGDAAAAGDRDAADRRARPGRNGRGAGEGGEGEGHAVGGRGAGVLGFLQDHVLAAARPEGQRGGLGKDVTVRAAVDAAEPTIAGAFRTSRPSRLASAIARH